MKRNELAARCGEGDVQITLVIHDGPRRVEALGAFVCETDADTVALDFIKARDYVSIEDYNERSEHTLDLISLPLR